MTDDTKESTIDPNRSSEIGGHWEAAIAIDANGEETFWLLHPDPAGEPGCACQRCAPHDWLDR